MKTLFCITSFLFTLFTLGSGQTGSSKPYRPLGKNERKARILYLNAEDSAPQQTFLYADGKLLQQSPLPRNNFSRDIKLPKGREKRIYFLPQEYTGPKDKFPTHAPHVTLPEAVKKCLFLVTKDEENLVMPISVFLLDASNSVYDEGSLFMINLSQHDVIGTLGEKQVSIRSKNKEIVRKVLDKGGYYPAILKVKGGTLREEQPFIKTMWPYSPKIRRMVFFLEGYSENTPRYHTLDIRDF